MTTFGMGLNRGGQPLMDDRSYGLGSFAPSQKWGNPMFQYPAHGATSTLGTCHTGLRSVLAVYADPPRSKINIVSQ